MSQPSTSQSVSQMIKKSKMHYAKKSTPEQRRLGKFGYQVNVQSSDSCERKEPPIKHGDPSGDDEEKPAEPSGSDVVCTKAPKKY